MSEPMMPPPRPYLCDGYGKKGVSDAISFGASDIAFAAVGQDIFDDAFVRIIAEYPR